MTDVNKVRDDMIRAMPQHADRILVRDAVVERWCAEHGKTKDALTIEEILEIRALPEWQRHCG